MEVYIFQYAHADFCVQATPEGTHFLIPWLQRAILYDCRIKPRVRIPSARVEGAVILTVIYIVEYFYDYGLKGLANGLNHSPSAFTTGC